MAHEDETDIKGLPELFLFFVEGEGWFWHSSFPGSHPPEQPAVGPFPSREAAHADAMRGE
jgi:hypothetical protein